MFISKVKSYLQVLKHKQLLSVVLKPLVSSAAAAPAETLLVMPALGFSFGVLMQKFQDPALFSQCLQGSWRTFRSESHWLPPSSSFWSALQPPIASAGEFQYKQEEVLGAPSTHCLLGDSAVFVRLRTFLCFLGSPRSGQKTFLAGALISILLLSQPKGKLTTWKLNDFSWTKTLSFNLVIKCNIT